LRFFIATRGSADAAPEIRLVAAGILGIMRQECPNLFGDIRETTDEHGFPILTTENPKV
jgi:thymidylate synthase ThyX